MTQRWLDTIVLVQKPLKWTSFDVVKKFRSITRVKKVGHAGTLDPLADGLLVLATGKATKKISEIQDGEKEYYLEGIIGAKTPSYDAEFKAEQTEAVSTSLEEIREVAQTMIGVITQTPPPYSAVKINGVPAYKLARQGRKVVLPEREVHIKRFDVLDARKPTKEELPDTCKHLDLDKIELIQARVVCSKGTYIRSLIDDLGKKLSSHGMLTRLRRTRIGEYNLSEAWTLQEIAEQNAVSHIEN